MNIEAARYRLKQLTKKYLALRSMEVVLWAFSAAIITFGVFSLFFSTPYLYLYASMAGLIVFVLVFRKLKLHELHEQKLVSFINQQYPGIEDSADLLTRDNITLSSLEQLQQQKTLGEFNQFHAGIKLPNKLGQAALIFCVSVAITFILSSFDLRQNRSSASDAKAVLKVSEKEKVRLPAAVKKITIHVTPPAYTGLSSSESNDPQLVVPEESDVRWAIEFTDTLEWASLILSAKETVKLTKGRNIYSASCRFKTSSFYQLQWKGKSGEIKTSDYYKVEVIRDQSPEITVHNLDQSIELTINDKLTIDLKSTQTDDYAIRDTYIIATVSKGSGESVKFREEKLAFTTPAKIDGKLINASRSIDLMKLGLEPGDELYFYAEAIDNKQPVANRSRTETYFITLQDTASQNLSVEGGLGVDLMPEYFRSQRQIIIDTEKLLKDRKKISKQAFGSKSNELGYDQKVLRIKYGEFLGEEFETQVGEGAHPFGDAPEEEDEDLTKKYTHAHDKENEHNLVEEKKPTQAHDHEGEDDPSKEKSLMDAYKHNHDDAEEATFFNQSIRSKLKAALTEMWDAELYLRLYQPEKSLPYQYKALKLLKEVSNDSRIYVHKTGFDPPPLKEEKRLSGDLAEIKNTRHQSALNTVAIYPCIRSALKLVEDKLNQDPSPLSSREKKILHEAGRELAGVALERPGQFLESLSLIKSINENEVKDQDMLKTLGTLKKTFWKVLPNEKNSADQFNNTTHPLDQAFIKNLEALKNK